MGCVATPHFVLPFWVVSGRSVCRKHLYLGSSTTPGIFHDTHLGKATTCKLVLLKNIYTHLPMLHENIPAWINRRLKGQNGTF